MGRHGLKWSGSRKRQMAGAFDAVMKLRVPKYARNYWKSWRSVNFWRRTVFHGVSSIVFMCLWSVFVLENGNRSILQTLEFCSDRRRTETQKTMKITHKWISIRCLLILHTIHCARARTHTHTHTHTHTCSSYRVVQHDSSFLSVYNPIHTSLVMKPCTPLRN